MGSRGRRLLSLLGAAALAVALGVWLLTREAGTNGPARDASVLSGGRTANEHAVPELPVVPAPGATPESLAAAAEGAPGAAADAPTAGNVPAALPGEKALFTGRVVDERGAPIAGATVVHVPTLTLRQPLGLILGRSAWDLAWDQLPRATTAADGTFSLPSREVARVADELPDADIDEEDDDFRVTEGVLPGLVVFHEEHAIRVHACATFRSGAHDIGDIVLAAGSALTGRLVAADGAVVAGADVGPSGKASRETRKRCGEWNLARHFLHVLSGADGRFVVSGFWPGEAELEIVHPDFVPRTAGAELPAGEVLDLGDLLLAPARHIRGVVLDADGRPLAGARLLARGSAHRMSGLGGGTDALRREMGSSRYVPGEPEVRVRTDDSGAFDLATLNETYYDVFAEMDDRDTACLRDVEAGTDDLVLTLADPATLLITVLDAVGRAPLAAVSARAFSHSAVEDATGGELGAELGVLAGGAAAAAAGLPGDGAGLLLVQRAGGEGTFVIVSAPGHATTGFVLPGVAPGERGTHTLELARQAVLEGLVQDTGQQPVADAGITLSWPGNSGLELPSRTATSDAAGRFRIDQLLPGTWELSAGAAGFLGVQPAPFEITAGAEPQQTVITLPRGGALNGLLLDAEGAPAGHETVEMSFENGPWAGARVQNQTDNEGRFQYPVLQPGPAVLRAWPGLEVPVVLVTGETSEVTVALRHLPKVRGRVTRAGQPVAQAQVVGLVAGEPGTPPTPPAYVHIGNEARPATTSATGEYELVFGKHGAHVVQARLGDAWSRPVAVATDWDRVELVDLVLGSAHLRGLVTDASTEQPVAGATVTLHERARDADTALATFPRAADLDPRVTTDAQGRFAFEQLQPGAFLVSVRATGYVDARREVAVTAEAAASPADVIIALEPGAGLRGTVRMASGKPLLPDLRVGLETAAHSAQESPLVVGADGAWAWPGSAMPGSGTLVVWRVPSTQNGNLAAEDLLASEPVTLVAGQTQVVELVLDG